MEKPSSPSRRISEIVHERGPLTVAEFMDLALYDSDIGYYARAAQRSGRAGDFFTSVDVGPAFGELLEIQLAEMADILADRRGAEAEQAEQALPLRETFDIHRVRAERAEQAPPLHRTFGINHVGAELARPDDPCGAELARPFDSTGAGPFDLVEAAAGNGRLAADILRAARRRHPAFYDRIRLHLVEASAAARAAQRTTLDDAVERLASSSRSLPPEFDGVLLANELLDALPVHQVVMRHEGLREVYVDTDEPGHLVAREGPPSTPALADYLARADVVLESGWRAEINLRAVEWIREAARRLGRGFIVVIDYGHEARELYSITHATGTLTTYARHIATGPGQSTQRLPWLDRPGECDLTAHVDFTSIRLAAEAEGLTTLGVTDQTYFLLGLLESQHLRRGGAEAFFERDFFTHSRAGRSVSRQLKTLLMPGGLGSTHKVMIFAKDVGTPALSGCSFRMRIT